MTVAPAIFVSHGAPMIALQENGFTRSLARWRASMQRDPEAIVIMSAHWQSPPTADVLINANPSPGVIHDFGGFDERLALLGYAAPGSNELAKLVATHLRDELRIGLDEKAGWDHGVWIPLRLLIPDASIPVVSISVPRSAETSFRCGELLRPLRRRGVMLVGSGGIVHNLRAIDFASETEEAEPWAAGFERWVVEQIEKRAFDELLEYRTHAPDALRAVPTPEHFDPLFFVAGAAAPDEPLVTVHEGFMYGTLSMRVMATARVAQP